jgi:hypothetical protein
MTFMIPQMHGAAVITEMPANACHCAQEKGAKSAGCNSNQDVCNPKGYKNINMNINNRITIE